MTGGDGDARAAFGKLAERYWRRAFAVALGVLRDAHEAEEAVQEGLLTAFVRIRTLRDPRRFGPWLARIVENEALGRLRRRRERPDAEAVEAAPAPAPADAARPWTDAELAAALADLTPNQRVVVSLRYLLGLAPREISTFLGLSPESVRKRLHDGLARLRERGARRFGPRKPAPSRGPIPNDRKEELMSRIPNVLRRILDEEPGDEAGASRSRDYQVVNLMDRLLEDRIVFLSGRIDREAATSATIQLLFLQKESREHPVHLYINSDGGDLFAGLAIYDTIRFLACPVHTYAIGQAGGTAALRLAAGTPGGRYALPHAAVMLHPPPGEGGGIEEHYREAAAARFRGMLVDLLARHSGAEAKKVDRDLTRGVFLTAPETKDYGLVDDVVGER